MQVTGRQVDTVAGVEVDSVEQHGGQYPGVTRIQLAELQDRLGLGDEFGLTRTDVVDRTVEHRGHQHVQIGPRQGDPGGEHRPQAVGVGLPGQQVDVRIQISHRQRAHEDDAADHRPEAGQGFERAQRDDQLGFVAAVAVITVRRPDRNTLPLFAIETLGGLLGAGVRLQRQRLVGGEHLGQKRQCRAESRSDRGPQLSVGIGRDGLQQRRLAGRHLQVRRVTRIRAQP